MYIPYLSCDKTCRYNKKHKQLTVELRYQLYALNKRTINKTKIAKQLGVHQPTISREFKSNIGKRGYVIVLFKAITRRTRAVSYPVMTLETIELLTPFKDLVLTITTDNGKEFSYHKEVSESLECDCFFTDPYCSWQRRLNENTNERL
ncbi:MAG: helix-turn-helix domain-containing protein [Psychromonas sp.]|nr:helix-turn-helix domain-containing protein [Psychromonas sp.]